MANDQGVGLGRSHDREIGLGGEVMMGNEENWAQFVVLINETWSLCAAGTLK